MKVLNDRSNVPVTKDGIIFRQLEAAIQDGVVIEDPWLTALVRVGMAKAPGMRQLQTDKKTLV